MRRASPSIRTLFSNHKGNVSDKWSIYLDEYSRLFAPYRNMPVQLLEIGIQNGGSLEIWAEYFQSATKLVGCDVDPACAQIGFATNKIEVVVGDANAPETINRIRSIADQYHIVIDDGSHKSHDIIKSFSHYFDMVREGGLYIAEDLHCSYWREYGGGLYHPTSSIMFFKALADIVNQEHWGIESTRKSVLEEFHSRYAVQFNEEALSQVHAIEFVNSMCVIRKAPSVQNGLGERCITGLTASVFPAVLGFGKDRICLDQTGNPWTTRNLTVAAELESTTIELGRLRASRDILPAEVDRLRHVDKEVKTREAEIERLLGREAELQRHLSQVEIQTAASEKNHADKLLAATEEIAQKSAAIEALHQQHALDHLAQSLEGERREAELRDTHLQNEHALVEQLEQLRSRLETVLHQMLLEAQAHARQLEALRESNRELAEVEARHRLTQTKLLRDEIRMLQRAVDGHLTSRILREEQMRVELHKFQQAATERETQQLQAHAQREQRLLTNLSESNIRAEAYVLQMAEIQKSFGLLLDRKEQQHRAKTHTRILEHQELIRNFEAGIRRKNQEILEGVEVVQSCRSLTTELRSELHRVYASFSWRWTAPLRKVSVAIGRKN